MTKGRLRGAPCENRRHRTTATPRTLLNLDVDDHIAALRVERPDLAERKCRRSIAQCGDETVYDGVIVTHRVAR